MSINFSLLNKVIKLINNNFNLNRNNIIHLKYENKYLQYKLKMEEKKVIAFPYLLKLIPLDIINEIYKYI